MESQKVWETNSNQSPPETVEDMIGQSERLLWLGVVPSQAVRGRTVTLGALSVIATALFIASAPWGQSVAEYCGPDPERYCRKYHLIVWLLIAAGGYLSVAAVHAIQRMRTAPWTFTYAISDCKAYIRDGRKPHLWQTVDLNRHEARVRPLDTVTFGRWKDRLPSFSGLDASAAKWAVYWANEGRLRPEFQFKATP